MSPTASFVAQLLESSAPGYAGLAASLLLERRPDIGERYAPDGLAGWKMQFEQWLHDLSAAVEAAEPKLFETRMLWTLRSFVARRAPVEDLREALVALRDTLRERLPEVSVASAVPIVEQALQAIAGARAAATRDADAGESADRDALAYLETILEGRPHDAVVRLLEGVDDADSARDVYLRVLMPAHREVGRMWLAGDLSIAEEHLITATTQRAMALIGERARPGSSAGKTALLACVAGNLHDVGLRAIADLFEMSGWRSINLGANVPPEEIARSVELFDADVVVLAAALDPHLRTAQRTIERIRALDNRKTRVVVGGPTFDRVPDLWRKVGADGYAASIDAVEPLASRLTG